MSRWQDGDMIFEDCAVDDNMIEADVRVTAAKILSADTPEDEITRIIRETGSVQYARHVAVEASREVAVAIMMMTVTVAPVPAGNLADFLTKARMRIALHE